MKWSRQYVTNLLLVVHAEFKRHLLSIAFGTFLDDHYLQISVYDQQKYNTRLVNTVKWNLPLKDTKSNVRKTAVVVINLGNIAVLAPVNKSMVNNLQSSVTKINKSNVEILVNILVRHIRVSQNINSSIFSDMIN